MKKVKAAAVILTFIITNALAGCSFPKGYEEEFFGTDTYRETKHICSHGDKLIVQPILYQIEKAFSYSDDSHDCEEQFGVLARYCLCKESYPDVVKENHDIKFVTAKINGSTGYIWIRYSQEGLDKDGNRNTGSKDVLSRIELEKTDDVWTAIDIDEAP